MTIVTHPDKKYYIRNLNKKQRQNAQSSERKVYKMTKKSSVECTLATKMEDLGKNKSKLKPKLFTPQHRIINSKRAHQVKRSGCRSESEIYYSRRD